jgi:hypothetical protein
VPTDLTRVETFAGAARLRRFPVIHTLRQTRGVVWYVPKRLPSRPGHHQFCLGGRKAVTGRVFQSGSCWTYCRLPMTPGANFEPRIPRIILLEREGSRQQHDCWLVVARWRKFRPVFLNRVPTARALVRWRVRATTNSGWTRSFQNVLVRSC